MAEAPAQAAPETAPQPVGQDAGLDAAIAAMESSIPELQRGSRTEAKAPPVPAPSVQEGQQPADTQGQPAEPVQGDAQEAEEAAEPEPKPGGRMARLREQLTAAETRAQQYEQHVQQRDQEYRAALSQFVDLVLPDAQLEQLRLQAEGGDWEAKQKVDTARAWRRMVAPIADLAHKASRQEFDQALADLRTLDGMDADSHQKLLAAASPGEKLKLMHQLAYKAATGEHKERIAALEAEVASLKTNRAANGSQPANGGGAANGTSGLAGLVGRDGQLTDEALKLSPAEIRARFGRVA